MRRFGFAIRTAIPPLIYLCTPLQHKKKKEEQKMNPFLSEVRATHTNDLTPHYRKTGAPPAVSTVFVRRLKRAASLFRMPLLSFSVPLCLPCIARFFQLPRHQLHRLPTPAQAGAQGAHCRGDSGLAKDAADRHHRDWLHRQRGRRRTHGNTVHSCPHVSDLHRWVPVYAMGE